MSAPKTKSKKPSHTCASLNKRIETLENQVADLLKLAAGPITSVPRSDKTIQKPESYNGEDIPLPDEGARLQMTHTDKLRSIDNAVRILAPTYLDKETNRHSLVNLKAICGFSVTQEMQDEVYANIKHEGGFVVPVE